MFFLADGAFFASQYIAGVPLTTTASMALSVGYRFALSGFSGVEMRYGYSDNTMDYLPVWNQQSHISELTVNYVATFDRSGAWQPYWLGGLGLLNFVPSTNNGNGVYVSGLPPVMSATKFTFDYGVGFDARLSGPVLLRLELRQLVYRVPDFGLGTASGARFASWGLLTEPEIGFVYQF